MKGTAQRNQQALPQNTDSEKAVLGGIIERESLFEDVSRILEPKDFYRTAHRKIFESMGDLKKEGAPLELLTIFERLKSKGLINETGGFTYLSSLPDMCPSIFTVGYHAGLVKKEADKRVLCAIAQTVDFELRSGKITPDQATEKFQETLEKVDARSNSHQLIQLSKCTEPGNTQWILQDAIPYGFPTIMYGAGGLGKSYIGLYLATLAALGERSFFQLPFMKESVKTLYLDWELDKDEFTRRAYKITRGLGLKKPPEGLFYYAPNKNLQHFLPELKNLITNKDIKFCVIDSLGASCVDPDRVIDIIQTLTSLRDLHIATLLIDHQAKMVAGDKYDNKTPFGSVYKFNLARSVFQLSSLKSEGRHVSVQLTHKKSNFGRLLDPLIFDIVFNYEAVDFKTSNALPPEVEKELEDMKSVHAYISDCNDKGTKPIQKDIIEGMRESIGQKKVVELLEKGKSRFWTEQRGDKNCLMYEAIENPVWQNGNPIYTCETAKQDNDHNSDPWDDFEEASK